MYDDVTYVYDDVTYVIMYVCHELFHELFRYGYRACAFRYLNSYTAFYHYHSYVTSSHTLHGDLWAHHQIASSWPWPAFSPVYDV